MGCLSAHMVSYELTHAFSVSWQISRGCGSKMASLPCQRPFMGCLGLPFPMCCLTLKEGGLGLVTRVFQEGDNEISLLRLRLRVLLLPCYIDQSESQGQPRFKGWKNGPRLFTSDSNNVWSCLMYHKCQCTLSLITHFLVARVSIELISIRKYPLCVHILLSIILYLLK